MSNKPVGFAKVLKKGKNNKAYWYKVGALFPTKNAKVHRLVLDALPVDGVLYLTEVDQDDTATAAPKDIEG